MTRTKFAAVTLAATLGLSAIVASFAADAPPDAKPAAAAAKPEMKLPPGWTDQDMQACMAACTPGKPHEYLAQGAGTWAGKCTMWMGSTAEPVKSDCTSTVTPIMDGHYTKVDYTGEMPGMGPYHGSAIYGFDNVAQKFVCASFDNHSTGIMNGTGDLSPDGKTLTWVYTFNCPLTKKPAAMREIQTTTGPTTKTLELFGPDPKTGKEYKMMTIELTKK